MGWLRRARVSIEKFVSRGKIDPRKTRRRQLGFARIPGDSWRKHGRAVKERSLQFGKTLGFSEKQLEEISIAADVHDAGKSNPEVARAFSGKSLTRADKERHVIEGVKMLRGFWEKKGLPKEDIERVVGIVAAHHERWDGKGYPNGLKGGQIPLEARALSIVDSYLAMTEKGRAYRKPKTGEEALKVIEEEAGKQFDPELAKIFVEKTREQKRKGG